jgi:hypothetical protein
MVNLNFTVGTIVIGGITDTGVTIDIINTSATILTRNKLRSAYGGGTKTNITVVDINFTIGTDPPRLTGTSITANLASANTIIQA